MSWTLPSLQAFQSLSFFKQTLHKFIQAPIHWRWCRISTHQIWTPCFLVFIDFMHIAEQLMLSFSVFNILQLFLWLHKIEMPFMPLQLRRIPHSISQLNLSMRGALIPQQLTSLFWFYNLALKAWYNSPILYSSMTLNLLKFLET